MQTTNVPQRIANLKLTDIENVVGGVRQDPLDSEDQFRVASYTADSLQMAESLVFSFSEKKAHQIAKVRWQDKAHWLGVVRNNRGNTVAIYYQGIYIT